MPPDNKVLCCVCAEWVGASILNKPLPHNHRIGGPMCPGSTMPPSTIPAVEGPTAGLDDATLDAVIALREAQANLARARLERDAAQAACGDAQIALEAAERQAAEVLHLTLDNN